MALPHRPFGLGDDSAVFFRSPRPLDRHSGPTTLKSSPSRARPSSLPAPETGPSPPQTSWRPTEEKEAESGRSPVRLKEVPRRVQGPPAGRGVGGPPPTSLPSPSSERRQGRGPRSAWRRGPWRLVSGRRSGPGAWVGLTRAWVGEEGHDWSWDLGRVS